MAIRVTLKRGNKRKTITLKNPLPLSWEEEARIAKVTAKYSNQRTMPTKKKALARRRLDERVKKARARWKKSKLDKKEIPYKKLAVMRGLKRAIFLHKKYKKNKRKNPNKPVTKLYLMGIQDARGLLRLLKKVGDYNAERDIPKIIDNLKRAMRGASDQVKEVNRGELAFWKYQQNLPTKNKPRKNPNTTLKRGMNYKIPEKLAFFLLEKTGSVSGQWRGSMTAKEQRALFGTFLGKGKLLINGKKEIIVHYIKTAFGLDFDSHEYTWRELMIKEHKENYGKKRNPKGSRPKITEAQKERIRFLYAETNMHASQIARSVGVSVPTAQKYSVAQTVERRHIKHGHL